MSRHGRVRTSEPPQAPVGSTEGVSLPRTPRYAAEGQRGKTTRGGGGGKGKKMHFTKESGHNDILTIPDGGEKSVSWELKEHHARNSKAVSPREQLKGFPYLGFISPHRPKMFYEEECKRTRQVPAPWDYADAQIKAAGPPAGTAMFSRSTENFNPDKWYRRTVFNAPEKADTTVAYPGPGAYDPIIKAHSRCRRVPRATIGHAIPPLPNDPPKYRPLPAISGSHNVPSESLVGRDVKPAVGMNVTMSQRQKKRLEVKDDHGGFIFEVDDSELFCMVEWRAPYPPEEEQYALALTGKNNEYWLAELRSPPPSPIEKKWLLDALVSPRYQFHADGLYSLPHRRTQKNLDDLRQVKAEVLHEARLQALKDEAAAKTKARQDRLREALRCQESAKVGALMTAGDQTKGPDYFPLDFLFSGGVKPTPKILDDTDAFEDEDFLRTSLIIDEAMPEEKTLSAEDLQATQEQVDSFEPMTTAEIDFLLRLHGVFRLLKKAREIRRRIRSHLAKQRLQKVVKQEVVPVIRLSRAVEGNGPEWLGKGKRAELKALRKQSKSVLVRDRFAAAKTIFHPPGKQLAPKPTGRLLRSLERLAQPRRGGGWEEEQEMEAGVPALPQQREDMMKASMKTRQKMDLAISSRDEARLSTTHKSTQRKKSPEVSVVESPEYELTEEADDGREDEEQDERGEEHENENTDAGQCEGGDTDNKQLNGVPGEGHREAIGAGMDLENFSEPVADAPHADDVVVEGGGGGRQPSDSIVGPNMRAECGLAEDASARGEDLEAEELLARRKSDIAEEVALLCGNRSGSPPAKVHASQDAATDQDPGSEGSGHRKPADSDDEPGGSSPRDLRRTETPP